MASTEAEQLPSLRESLTKHIESGLDSYKQQVQDVFTQIPEVDTFDEYSCRLVCLSDLFSLAFLFLYVFIYIAIPFS